MNEEKRRMNRTQGRYVPASENSLSHRKKESMESHKHDADDKKHNRNGESSTRSNGKQVFRRNSQKFADNETYSEQPTHPVKKRESNVSEMNIEVKYEEGAKVGFYSGLEEKPRIETLRNYGWHTLSVTGEGVSKIFYEPDFIELKKADDFFNTLKKKVKWFDKKIVIHGEEHRQPRLVAWFGPLPYTYSGVTLQPKEFPPMILVIKEMVENVLKGENVNVDLNSVLLNLYRDEKDSVAWHSDDESSMGIQPTIASVSLGEMRRFEMRKKPKVIRSEDPPEYVVHLKHGSLVVMDGVMQTDWQHRVPKEYHSKEPRINLTFRTVYAIEKVSHRVFSPSKDAIAFIPPPHPKMKPEPFQFQEEVFPALGETANHFHSKLQQPVGSQPAKASTKKSSTPKSVDTEMNSNTDYKNETEPVHISCNSPIRQPSTTEFDNQGVWDENNVHDSSNQNVVTDVTMEADSNISETWKELDISKVAEFIPKSQFISKKEYVNQHTPEKRERTNRSYKEHHHRRQRTNSGSADNSEKHKTSNQKVNHSKSPKHDEYDEDDFEIQKLHNIYDYIYDRQDDIPFRRYHWDELHVLLCVVEHSQFLPTNVISMLSNRMEHLIDDAERKHYDNRQQHHYDNYGKGSRSYYGSNNNKGCDKRY